MFDFDSDKVDPRFAPKGKTPTQDEPQNRTAPSAGVTRQSSQPVSIPDKSIPVPPPLPRATGTPRDRTSRRRAASAVKRTDWAWLVIAAALILVFAVLGISLAALANAGQQPVDTSQPTQAADLPTPVDARSIYQPMMPALNEQVTLDDGSSIVLQPWNGTSRLNVLVMGIDRRPNQDGLGYRSDTMMVVSFDPTTTQLGILSIPRDMYVQVPGYNTRQRINTALALGELQKPGYGPTLAMQTVQYNVGMGINAYLIVDFTAMIKLVDAIGGIDINVPEPIADYQFPDMNNGFDPLILKAGLQHMDGYTAQKYARTRHGDSDFERARRQQDVLFAIRDKILHLDSFPQLVAQAPSLYASLNQNVYTELSLQQMIQLGLWLKDLPSGNIHTGVIDQDYVSDFTTPDGAEVLMPNTATFPKLLAQVFGSDYKQP